MVRSFDSLSAHADRVEIVQWLRHFERSPAQVFLTHGEPAAADALRKHVAEALGWEAQVPDYLETCTVLARHQAAAAGRSHAAG